jgi:23S rRNA (guanosine2251-2'-O)-methyltransferase
VTVPVPGTVLENVYNLSMHNNEINQNKYIYGIHTVKALLKANPQKINLLYLAREKTDRNINEILEMAKDTSIQVKTLSINELNSIMPKVSHQGVVAKIRSTIKTYNENDLENLLETSKKPVLLLILDGIQDPHNLGASIRSANAAGVDAVIAPKDRAVGLTTVAQKVASGAAETTPFIQVTNLARTMTALKSRGIWLYGASETSETSIYDVNLKGPLAFVLGGEGQGLRRLTKELCDFLVSIPMHGTVSNLNVSVAASICLFEAVRQRINL